MKAEIDRDGCIACGLCVGTCPEVFRMGEDGPAEVYIDMVPADCEQSAIQAQDGCPVSVISID